MFSIFEVSVNNQRNFLNGEILGRTDGNNKSMVLITEREEQVLEGENHGIKITT